MSHPRQTVSVYILDKEYRILCHPEESEGLKMSALFLDKKMREIRNSGKVVGMERIAIMAALNISHEYFVCNSQKEEYVQDVRRQVQQLEDKLEESLLAHNALESDEETV